MALVFAGGQRNFKRMVHQNIQCIQVTVGDFSANNVIMGWFNADNCSFCTNRNLRINVQSIEN